MNFFNASIESVRQRGEVGNSNPILLDHEIRECCKLCMCHPPVAEPSWLFFFSLSFSSPVLRFPPKERHHEANLTARLRRRPKRPPIQR